MKLNYCLERTGCKSEVTHKKSMEEYALFVLGVTPVPAFQVGRYTSQSSSNCMRELLPCRA
jgi:hypothetical protein